MPINSYLDFERLVSEERRNVIKKLWHDIVDAYEPGKADLAYKLDVSYDTLLSWYREDKPYRLPPLDKLIVALHVTQDFRLIEFILTLFNKAIFEKPDYCTKIADLHLKLAESAKEYADFFRAGAESLTDGMLDPAEIRQLEREYSEASVKMAEALGVFKQFSKICDTKKEQKLKVVGE
jgi:hypothetical protein